MTSQLYFKLCSDHVSIEAIPKRRVRVNFRKMKEHKIRDHELVMWTPHFAVMRNAEGHEITLRQDGRMIVRKAASEMTARKSAQETMEIVLKEFAL
jgi:hypothetical protein